MRSFAIRGAALALISLALIARATGSPDAGKAEKQQLTKIAEEWVVLGKWCVSKKLATHAKLCQAKAETADATYFGLKAYKESVASTQDGATDADEKEWEKKLQASG